MKIFVFTDTFAMKAMNWSALQPENVRLTEHGVEQNLNAGVRPNNFLLVKNLILIP